MTPARREQILTLGVIIALFGVLLWPERGYVPIWDGHVYANCVVDAATRNGFDLNALRCAGHPSYGWAAILALSQLAAPGDAADRERMPARPDDRRAERDHAEHRERERQGVREREGAEQGQQGEESCPEREHADGEERVLRSRDDVGEAAPQIRGDHGVPRRREQ